jgi:small nuclear ribonucleoprotein (snRNP)-like protein
MTYAVAVGVMVGVFLFGAGLYAAQDRLLRRRMKSEVVATLKSGAAFRGVLMDVDPRTLILRNAEILNGEPKRVVVDGELVLSRVEVNYLQRLP